MVWKLLWKTIVEERMTQAALVAFLLFISAGIYSLSIPKGTMYDPLTGTDPSINGFSQPSSRHLMGTDYEGKDIFFQILAGSTNALIRGLIMGVLVAIPVFFFAFIMAWRGFKPSLEHPSLSLFVFLPFCAIQVWFMFALPAALILGGSVARLVLFLLLTLPPLFFMAWKSFGHLMVSIITERDETTSFLEFSFSLIPIFFLMLVFIMSWENVLYSQLCFLGLGDPNTIAWGMMLLWCWTTGYIFIAPFWLLPPGICIWGFSAITVFIAWRGYTALLSATGKSVPSP